MELITTCITQEANWLACAVNSQVKLLDLEGRRLAAASQADVQWRSLACTADGKRLAAVGEVSKQKSVLYAWAYKQQRLQILWKRNLGFSADWVTCSSTVVAVASSDAFLSLRWETGETLLQARLRQRMLCGHIQTDTVWTGDDRGNLWRIDNTGVRRIANFGVGEIFCIASHDNTLYLGSADTLIHTYDIQKSQPGSRMLGHRSEVACLQCTLNQIVSVGLQGDISLWKSDIQYPQNRLQLDSNLPQAIACPSAGRKCWVLLSNGLYHVDWSQLRARVVLSRSEIIQA